MEAWSQPSPGTLAFTPFIPKTTPIRVAGFDLDYTLVRSYLSRFPGVSTDYKFLPNRLETLEKYAHQGYLIAIFTNNKQKSQKQKIMVLNRVINILNQLKYQTWAFISTEDDQYRKPRTGMWDLMTETLAEGGVRVDLENSFYVGDAAGRPGDFADSDRKFAENIGIKFYTPEEIFPGNTLILNPRELNLVVFMGMPGSGEDSYYEKYLAPLGVSLVDSDIIKDKDRQLHLVEQELLEGRSVAISATNPGRARRQEFIQLGRKYGALTVIVYMVRNGYEWNQLRERPVPAVVYNIYYSKLEEPTAEEAEVVVEIDRV